jgi:hypothetical protein
MTALVAGEFLRAKIIGLSREQLGCSRLLPKNQIAGMAELADALALGASGRKAVQVQVLFSAPCCSLTRRKFFPKSSWHRLRMVMGAMAGSRIDRPPARYLFTSEKARSSGSGLRKLFAH